MQMLIVPAPMDALRGRARLHVMWALGLIAHAGEFRMLEIVWRNPNSLVRTRMSVDKIWLHDPVTGQAQAIYRTRAVPGSPEVEYELVVSRRKPVCAA
jgi:hypothetical protein